MSFDWKDYVDISEKFLENNDEFYQEAYLRSAVSRAYYGVFCIARNKKELLSKRDRNVHRDIINKYKNSENRIERKIGKNLDELRSKRNLADYDEKYLFKKTEVERIVIIAKEILKALQDI